MIAYFSKWTLFHLTGRFILYLVCCLSIFMIDLNILRKVVVLQLVEQCKLNPEKINCSKYDCSKLFCNCSKVFNSSLRYTYFCIDKTTYLIDLLTFLTPIIRRILLIQIISNTYFGKTVCLLNTFELSRFIFFFQFTPSDAPISFSSLICYFSKINWETCFY